MSVIIGKGFVPDFKREVYMVNTTKIGCILSIAKKTLVLFFSVGKMMFSLSSFQ